MIDKEETLIKIQKMHPEKGDLVIVFFPIFVFLPIASEPGWPGGWMNGVQETYSG